MSFIAKAALAALVIISGVFGLILMLFAVILGFEEIKSAIRNLRICERRDKND